MAEKAITLHICGNKLCRDGQPHDDLKYVVIRNSDGAAIGGTLACSRCGQTTMERDMWRLP